MSPGKAHPKKILSSPRTQGLAELRLAGLDLADLEPLEEEFLFSHLDWKKSVFLTMVRCILTAINELALASAVDGRAVEFKNTRNNIKDLQDLLFPEHAKVQEDQAAKAKRILEREFARGPLQVKAMDYTKKRRKKSR